MSTDKTPLWAPKYAPGSETKGGGLRGGPKRWTGKGPKPARHIPWPEIFKHHLSVVEGHQKMIDMVRKHTQPDTGNFRTISAMLDRCHEMLAMTKKASRDFVSPRETFESVPVGSSSASMYPGYSPADHEYGVAAEEYGTAVSQAKAAGVAIKSDSDGPEYEIGQAKGAGYKAAKLAARSSVPNISAKGGVELDNGTAKSPKPTEKPVDGEANEYFVVDSFPVRSPGLNKDDPQDEAKSEGRPSKKSKKSHQGTLVEPQPVVEHEDISEEVDQRLKEKEEKKRVKKEKKRKRESPDENAVNGTAPTDSVNAELEVAQNPKEKKKSKKSKATEDPATLESDSKKRSADDDEGSAKKKKKKQNSSKE